MRLLICAGGTGGGVNPALAVLQTLGSEADSVLWVGGKGGMEQDLVNRASVPFTAISAAGVHGVGLRTLPKNLWKLSRGYFEARKIIREYQPDVMFFTGGYVAVPMALAGRQIPILIYVPDIEPGLALKVLARFADLIAVTAEDSRPYFPRHADIMISGYPTRPDLGEWNPTAARQALNLEPDWPVLLVVGGSKGAHTINQAVLPILPELLGSTQIVHVTGQTDWDQIEAARGHLPADLSARYHPYPYLHEKMGAALAAADLALSRAGASTLGEFPLFGLPAVLVPYPYAWRYQKVNADYLVRRGAAVMLEDGQMADKLLPTLKDLLSHPIQLESMRAAMSLLAKPHAATEIAAQLMFLASSRSRRKK